MASFDGNSFLMCHMNDEVFCLNENYSTTRLVTCAPPIAHNLPDAKIANMLFLPLHSQHKSEGGLRVQGYFKACGCFSQYSKDSQTCPLVTVITVVFNGEAHLDQTILSVLNQTYNNVEYIIIDGGSTDGTMDIIRKYNGAIDYWISEPDEGISSAFNKGLSASTGLFVGIINADDWYELDTVETVVSIMRWGGMDIVHGQLRYWREQDKPKLVFGDHRLLVKDMTVNHATVFSTRAMYQRIGGFSPQFRYAMDHELLLRAKIHGASFRYIDKCLANLRGGGLSDRQWRKALKEIAYAKVLHSSATLGPWVYYASRIVISGLRRILQNVGMTRVVNFYHARFSTHRKLPTEIP